VPRVAIGCGKRGQFFQHQFVISFDQLRADRAKLEALADHRGRRTAPRNPLVVQRGECLVRGGGLNKSQFLVLTLKRILSRCGANRNRIA
jgi:hypothetical protein